MNEVALSISEVRAMYFDEDALLLSPYRIFRYHYKGDRYYYYRGPVMLAEDGMPTPETAAVQLAVGVTTLTKRTIPQDEFLTKWIADKGYDEAITYRDERSNYGSLWHTICAELLIKRKFDLDLLPEIVTGYALKKALSINPDAWVDGLKQDTLAVAQFFADYHVKPLAIEMSLVSPLLKVAGTLDLFCEMDKEEKGFFGEVYASGPQKGNPKETKRTVRQLAIVDFKSGRNVPNSKHNAAQLSLLRLLLDEMMQTVYGSETRSLQMGLFNLHPSDWRSRPGYKLVDQSGVFTADMAVDLVHLYKAYDPSPEEKTVLKMQGIVSLDSLTDDNYKLENIKQLVQSELNAGQVAPAKYDSVEDYIDFEVIAQADEDANVVEA